MKGAIIAGVIVIVLAGIFTMFTVSQYVESSLTGDSPEIEELSMPIIAGSIGVFAGIGLIVIGIKFCSSH